MEKTPYAAKQAVVVAVVLLGLLAFVCCVSAEFKKAEGKRIKLDGALCALPRTPAFHLGIMAMLCLSVAQIVGTYASRNIVCVRRKTTAARGNRWMVIMSLTLPSLSWVSFTVAMILLGLASSMNKGQTYGRGWMDGECYVVKHGIFIVAALLDLVTVACMLALIYMGRRLVPSDPSDNAN